MLPKKYNGGNRFQMGTTMTTGLSRVSFLSTKAAVAVKFGDPYWAFDCASIGAMYAMNFWAVLRRSE